MSKDKTFTINQTNGEMVFKSDRISFRKYNVRTYVINTSE